MTDTPSTNPPITASPLRIFREGLHEGELRYQQNSRGDAIFYPRLVCPFTGMTDLEWRTSSGRGTVYSTTVVVPREGEPYNVALINLDEGFRLMSRVEGIDPSDVTIGMLVGVAFHRGSVPDEAFHVFMPLSEQ